MSTVDFAPAPRRTGHAAQARWVGDTEDLVGQVKLWAAQAGWSTEVEPVTLTENGVGTYAVPVLTVQAPAGRLTVEPVALRTPELDGRVDLYGYPSLARMLLLRDATGARTVWQVRTSDDVDWPVPWGQEAFFQIAKGLLRGS